VICLMEIKISLNQLIIIGFLAVLYQFFFIKAFYLLFLPGLFFLVLFTDFDFLKALAFSLPVSLILYVLPYFVITRAGLPVNYVFYLLVPLFMLIYLLVTKRFTFSYSKKFNLVNIVLLIILLSAVSYVYSPCFTLLRQWLIQCVHLVLSLRIVITYFQACIISLLTLR